MVNALSTLFTLALAASAVSAIDITFKRYSHAGCHSETDHIAADTHLHDPHCKSFDTDEPAFYSFLIDIEDDREDLDNKYCYTVVYDQTDCKGQAFTYGDMKDYVRKCADSTIAGRSVRISCQSGSTTVTGVLPSTLSTFVTEHVRVEVETTPVPDTTMETVTLVPKPKTVYTSDIKTFN